MYFCKVNIHRGVVVAVVVVAYCYFTTQKRCLYIFFGQYCVIVIIIIMSGPSLTGYGYAGIPTYTFLCLQMKTCTHSRHD